MRGRGRNWRAGEIHAAGVPVLLEQCVSQLLAGRLQPVATRYLRTQCDAEQGDVARKASWYLFTGSIR